MGLVYIWILKGFIKDLGKWTKRRFRVLTGLRRMIAWSLMAAQVELEIAVFFFLENQFVLFWNYSFSVYFHFFKYGFPFFSYTFIFILKYPSINF